ncbi:MAG TPA: hypothetical protein VEK57_14990 [Thermoanaerobaculia bacterium]|nr:hypothetical protein [Thermoanaerobaculia bacterium]
MSVDYETFRRLPIEERRRFFNEAGPAERAALVQAQIRGWLDLHRTRLTPEQIAVMEANAAFVRPELYEGRNDPRETEALAARTAQHFDFDEMRQALTIHGSDGPLLRAAELELPDVPNDPSAPVVLQITSSKRDPATVQVRVHAGEELLAERAVSLIAPGLTGKVPEQPAHARVDGLLAGIAAGRVRITVTPPSGVRIWAVAAVIGPDGTAVATVQPGDPL